MEELSIIQKTYDLIKWYVPILNRLPRNHKFTLGDRMTVGLYDLLEQLIVARYAKEKLTQLESLNSRLDILRYQTRLLLDFELIPGDNLLTPIERRRGLPIGNRSIGCFLC